MNLYRVNLFFAWLLMLEVGAMGWIAFVGRMLLELLGVATQEEGIPGRIVGLLLLFGAIFAVQELRGALIPVGNPKGNGFRFGHRLLLVANILAALLLGFEMTRHLLTDHNLILVLARFTDAFGYWVLAMWAIGFSFIYQSALPAAATK